MPFEADIDLLASQWRSKHNLVNFLASVLEIGTEQVLNSHSTVEVDLNVDVAGGAWLDRIGEVIGLPRPSITASTFGATFGFDDAGTGFEQSRFADIAAAETRVPLGDGVYRAFLKARIATVVSHPSLPAYRRSIVQIDPSATVTDNNDMTYTVDSDMTNIISIAETHGVLPVPVGVRRIDA